MFSDSIFYDYNVTIFSFLDLFVNHIAYVINKLSQILLHSINTAVGFSDLLFKKPLLMKPSGYYIFNIAWHCFCKDLLCGFDLL